nr:exportin-7 isoform X1 [Ipomoea batatas]
MLETKQFIHLRCLDNARVCLLTSFLLFVYCELFLLQQLYAKLSELLGLHDHMLILNVIVGKIATNLKCYGESDEVIDQSLNLMLEMATGYMTAKLLLKLDTTQLIISNCNREQFPFLRDYRSSRSRTTFYYILGLLIFMEDSFLKFKASMDPILQVFYVQFDWKEKAQLDTIGTMIYKDVLTELVNSLEAMNVKRVNINPLSLATTSINHMNIPLVDMNLSDSATGHSIDQTQFSLSLSTPGGNSYGSKFLTP